MRIAVTLTLSCFLACCMFVAGKGMPAALQLPLRNPQLRLQKKLLCTLRAIRLESTFRITFSRRISHRLRLTQRMPQNI